MSDNLPAVTKYEVLADSSFDLSEIREYVHDIGLFDLEWIKVPSGESPFFSIQTPDGERPTPTVRGIVIGSRSTRIYWSGDRSVLGGRPPDCSSQDGDVGHGKRWDADNLGAHDCATCPLHEFGSDGRGQACQENMLVMLIRPEKVIPSIVKCPATSIGNMKGHFLRLFSSRLRPYQVETEISLEPAANSDGVKYFKLQAKVSRRLNPEELAGIEKAAKTLKEVFGRVREPKEVK